MDVDDQLEYFLTEPWSKDYIFVNEDGSEVLARETMAETEYSYTLPVKLIDLLLADEQQLLEEMRALDGLAPPYAQLAEESVRRHEDLIRSYTTARKTLNAHQGPFFKRSTLKGDAALEFVPVNLHVQRLCARSADASGPVLLDVVTVGAFTAFSQRFADGGLLQYAHLLGGRPLPATSCSCLPRRVTLYLPPLLRMLERLSPGGRREPDACKMGAVYQAENTVENIDAARVRILEAGASLLDSADSGDDASATSALLRVIQTESVRIESVLRSPALADSRRFLLHRRPDGTAPLCRELVPPGTELARQSWPAPDAVTAAAAGVGAELAAPAGRLPAVLAALRAGADAALVAARLSRAVVRLREERLTQTLRDAARHRRDVCFSHAVTAATVALMSRLWRRHPQPAPLSLWAAVGPLLQFEGLLSYYRHEACMVQDMVVAVQDLASVEFVLRAAEETREVVLEGGRGRLRVLLPTPSELLLGRFAQSEVRFYPCPIFFNVGINEQATFAEYVAGTGPQRALNETGYRGLADYVNSVSARRLLPDGPDDGSLSDLVVQLGHEVGSGRAKNVLVLQLASQICRRVSGLRFTSCKSAKDRTSMSVTLEQANVLTSELRLSSPERQRALIVMRTCGTRRKNAQKNVGSPRYSFRTLQLLTMPDEYRPPAGTYGAVAS